VSPDAAGGSAQAGGPEPASTSATGGPGHEARAEPSGAGGTLAITVNGEPRQVAPGTSVAHLVDALVADARGLAVAIDREVVPRAEWAGTVLRAGAAVEVVTAAAGG
jgi:sulfur carrier protein